MHLNWMPLDVVREPAKPVDSHREAEPEAHLHLQPATVTKSVHSCGGLLEGNYILAFESP